MNITQAVVLTESHHEPIGYYRQRYAEAYLSSDLMKKLIRTLTGFFLLIVMVLSLGFMRANDALISLSFGVIESQERPVGLWIAAAFVLGGLLGLMVGLRLFSSLIGRLEIARLRSRIAKLEASKEANLSR